jgi:hypothetical protein
MKRPAPYIYLVGNPASMLAIALLAIYLVYEWWIGVASPVAAIVAFALAASAFKANDRLEHYQEWKREWQVMNGEIPAAGRLLVPARTVRVVLGGIGWCVMAAFSLNPGTQPELQIASVMFWILTLVLIANAIYRWFKQRRGARPTRDEPIAICLSVPRQSPALRQAYAELPAYCVALFRASSRDSNTPVP